ncbi:MAG: Hsp20/alpha crystallin family protein [Acidobacteria bacterium]|nr:MAG: Hsp20/alpha crystallin family protein [Acidobacteriota bacterium]
MKSWDPFADLLTIQDRMNKLFEHLLSAPVSAEVADGDAGYWRPVAEVARGPEHVEISCELAGLSRDDVELHAEGNVLVVAGTRNRAGDESWTYHQVERPHGHFLRKFELPEPVDLSSVETALEDGLLRIRIPLRAAAPAPR